MANLSFSVGTFSSEINPSDNVAMRIVQAGLGQLGEDTSEMTGQEQANAFIAHTVSFWQELAKAQEVSEAVEAARDAAILEAPVFD